MYGYSLAAGTSARSGRQLASLVPRPPQLYIVSRVGLEARPDDSYIVDLVRYCAVAELLTYQEMTVLKSLPPCRKRVTQVKV